MTVRQEETMQRAKMLIDLHRSAFGYEPELDPLTRKERDALEDLKRRVEATRCSMEMGPDSI